MKLKFNLLLIFLFFGYSAMGQVPDTIYVYDTIYVHDTIRIHKIETKTLSELEFEKAVLEIDTVSMNAILMIFNDKKTATIPIKGIILNENIKNLNDMKKVSFIGIVFLAFKTMVLAQTNFGVSIGANSWIETQQSPKVNSPVMPGIKVGGYLRHNILKDKFAVGIDVNYGYLFGTDEYTIEDTYEIEMEHHLDPQIYVEPLKNAFETNYHQLSVPVYLMWKAHKLKPLIGAYYNFKRSTKKYDIFNPFDSGYDLYTVNFHSFGIYTGIHYAISDNISVGLNYSHGLNKTGINYKAKGLFFEAGGYSLRNSQLDFSICYTFSKKDKNDETN